MSIVAKLFILFCDHDIVQISNEGGRKMAKLLNGMGLCLVSMIMSLGVLITNSATSFLYHQPVEPEEMKQFRK